MSDLLLGNLKGSKIIAHKCGAVEARQPDNSMEALEYSIDKVYIDGIELDIQITSDNHLVVMHNSRINNSFIWNLSLEQLKQDYFINEGIEIRTLEEMLETLPNNKQMLIEIKSVSAFFNPGRCKRILDRLNQTINNHKDKNVEVICFASGVLEQIRELNSNIPTTLLTELKSLFYEPRTILNILNNPSIDSISFEKGSLNRIVANYVLSKGKGLGVFTIKSEEQLIKTANTLGSELLEKYNEQITLTTSIPEVISNSIKRR